MAKRTRTAAISLNKWQVYRTDRFLVLDGSPSDARTQPITRTIKDVTIDETAKTDATAIDVLRSAGFRKPTVKLEKWRFPDPTTDDFHYAKVWVVQLPKQGSSEKRKARIKPRGKVAAKSKRN